MTRGWLARMCGCAAVVHLAAVLAPARCATHRHRPTARAHLHAHPVPQRQPVHAAHVAHHAAAAALHLAARAHLNACRLLSLVLLIRGSALRRRRPRLRRLRGATTGGRACGSSGQEAAGCHMWALQQYQVCTHAQVPPPPASTCPSTQNAQLTPAAALRAAISLARVQVGSAASRPSLYLRR